MNLKEIFKFYLIYIKFNEFRKKKRTHCMFKRASSFLYLYFSTTSKILSKGKINKTH